MKKLKKIPEIGTEMYDMMVKLYPICRSITGDGVRKTLDIISEQIPLENQHVYCLDLPSYYSKKELLHQNLVTKPR